MSLQIARTINRTIMEQGLRDLGQLEQDLVFGDAGRKDVIKFLSTNHVRCSVLNFHTSEDFMLKVRNISRL